MYSALRKVSEPFRWAHTDERYRHWQRNENLQYQDTLRSVLDRTFMRQKPQGLHNPRVSGCRACCSGKEPRLQLSQSPGADKKSYLCIRARLFCPVARYCGANPRNFLALACEDFAAAHCLCTKHLVGHFPRFTKN
jgi:hypothetical protein